MRMELLIDKRAMKNLDKAMREIPARVVRKVVGQASRKAMKPIVKDGRQLVPRRFGLLRKSLGTVQKKYNNTGVFYTIVGPRTGFRDPTTGANPVNYAHLVEKGTAPHTIRTASGKTRQHPGAKPRPFLRRAFDRNVGAVQRILFESMRAGIDMEAIKFKPPTFYRAIR